jgi:hypothetical protein
VETFDHRHCINSDFIAEILRFPVIGFTFYVYAAERFSQVEKLLYQ